MDVRLYFLGEMKGMET